MFEAPTIMEKIQIPNSSIKLSITSDKNNKFDIKIYYINEYLYIEGIIKENFPQKSYKRKYNLNEIKENKFFYMCENVQDVYEELDNLINSQLNENLKGEILEESNFIILRIPLNTKKIKECLFQIDEIVSNTEQKFNELYSTINELKIQLENKDQQIKTLQKEINEIKSIFQEQIKKEKERISDLNNISKWIDPNKKITYNLLFKKTRDGDTTQRFHAFCDNKGKTVTIIETIEGNKFGGFTNENWDKSKCKKNENDFVFSLNLNKMYKLKSGDSIYCGESEGPYFGHDGSSADIRINNNTLNYGETIGNSYGSNKELNGGKKEFIVKEIDVYQVLID